MSRGSTAGSWQWLALSMNNKHLTGPHWEGGSSRLRTWLGLAHPASLISHPDFPWRITTASLLAPLTHIGHVT